MVSNFGEMGFLGTISSPRGKLCSMPTKEAIMAMKFLVTISTPDQVATIQGSGCDILAEYPNTMLVRCETAEADALRAQGWTVTPPAAT